MKTLRHKEVGNLKRRPNEEAHKMFETGKWEYVPKSVWKEQTRYVGKTEEISTGKKKSNKMSKSSKRHLRKKNK